MSRFLKTLLIVLVFAVCICLTFILSVQWAMNRQADLIPTDAVYYKIQSLGQLFDTYFIDEYDPSVMEEAAADGAAAAMVEATGDRWSFYISASDMDAYEEQMNNSYVGIGVTILEVEDGMQVMAVMPGSPAEEAGVQADDICVEVEGQKTAELGLDKTQELVRGEEGTYVSMGFTRNGTLYHVDIQRRAIVSDVATLQMLEDDIALIKIANFDMHCARQTLSCISDAMDQGAKALLFDVRFNGGGLKDEMVEILDALLPEGDVFRSVDYRGVEEVEVSDASCIEIPMAVLVNEDSYSAAEFFAAALQEYGVAQVIGAQTIGKGNFQYTLDVGDGSAVSLSVGKYYTPNGISLTDVGVTPDVEVGLPYEEYLALYYGNLAQDKDEQLQAAIEALKEMS